MKAWYWILLLLAVACVAAFGWHWVAADPGYVLLQIRGWRIETSVIVLLAALLLAWWLLALLGRFVRSLTGAASRRRERQIKQRMAGAIEALAEGRYRIAEREAARVKRPPGLRAPALMLAAESARRRGDFKAALGHLDAIDKPQSGAVDVLRAGALFDQGQYDETVDLLADAAKAGGLPPSGWQLFAEAALAAGQPHRAHGALVELEKTKSLDPQALAGIQDRVLRAALAAAPNAEALEGLWRNLSRGQRARPGLVVEFARSASVLGADIAAMDELESALKQHWSAKLITAWGELRGNHPDARIRRAEKWLDERPDDPALLAALGNMCAREGLTGKAREYLARALAIEPEHPRAWEALGGAAAADGDFDQAAKCYRNALGIDRGEKALPVRSEVREAAELPSPEDRGEHGFPRLSGN